MRLSEHEYAALLARGTARELAAVPARENLPPAPTSEPEKRFLERVRRLARDNGFATYHTQRSEKSERGFPDLCMVRPTSATRPGRLIFAELKSPRGQLTRDQMTWLRHLEHAIPGVEVYCWRPGDLPTICEILSS